MIIILVSVLIFLLMVSGGVLYFYRNRIEKYKLIRLILSIVVSILCTILLVLIINKYYRRNEMIQNINVKEDIDDEKDVEEEDIDDGKSVLEEDTDDGKSVVEEDIIVDETDVPKGMKIEELVNISHSELDKFGKKMIDNKSKLIPIFYYESENDKEDFYKKVKDDATISVEKYIVAMGNQNDLVMEDKMVNLYSVLKNKDDMKQFGHLVFLETFLERMNESTEKTN